MEDILDFEYILREVDQDRSENGIADCEAARRKFGSERDALFRCEEEVNNFRLYGATFEGETPPDPPEWSRFVNESQSYLANKSKDLWICVWLTEVLIAQSGYRGIAAGFQLIRETAQQYWEQLEPSPSAEGGAEYTLKLLTAVSRREAFLDAIRFAPITMESGMFLPASVATLDSLDGGERGALIGDTTDEFISDLYQSAKKAIEEWELIDDVLEEKCGDAKPPSAKVRETLTDCLNQITSTYPQVIVEDEPEVADEGGVIVTTNSTELGGNSLSGDSHLRNREQAFKTLEMLSRYFAENEPNSPVSSLLRQAARFGRLSFAELMAELADDDDARDQILRLAGIGKNADGDYEDNEDG